MIRLHAALFAAAVAGSVACSAPALAQCAVPHVLTNGQIADASQVMDNFEAVAECATDLADTTVTHSGTPQTGKVAVFSSPTSVTSADLSGDVTTSGGTVTTLASTGVTAGLYANPTITVDAKGRVTAASNGSGSGGGGDVLLATYTTGASETSFTLMSSIPQNFRKLRIEAVAGSTSSNTGNSDAYHLRFNNDGGSSYAYTGLGWYNATNFTASDSSHTSLRALTLASTGASSMHPAASEVEIPNYALTSTLHSVMGKTVTPQVNVGLFGFNLAGFWYPNAGGTPAAIDRIDVVIEANAFSTGSVFKLFGVN